MSSDYSSKNNAIQNAIDSSYTKNPGTASGYQLSPGMTYQVPKTWKFEEKITKATTCYVIATWSGQRRAGNNVHHKNPIFYLENHFNQLRKFKHSLDKIILVSPTNGYEPGVFKRYISNLPSNIGSTELELIRRPNVGQSYGSYADAFKQRPDYDYYIFMEDDYAPVMDNFDEILIQMYEHSPECGYLCSYAHSRPPEGPHAAISNGIARNDILVKMRNQLGGIQYAGNITNKVIYSSDPQLEFSRAFMKIHTKIYDYLSYYNSPFNEAGILRMYGDKTLPTLIQPIQFL